MDKPWWIPFLIGCASTLCGIEAALGNWPAAAVHALICVAMVATARHIETEPTPWRYEPKA